MKFSIDKIVQYAEIVGGVSVLLGLMFVGFEIRQNTKTLKFNLTQVLFSEYNESLRVLSSESDSCMIMRGFNSFNGLEPPEKMVFSATLLAAMRTWEQMYYASIVGMIDLNVYSGLDRQVRSSFELQGIREYWLLRRDWFGAEYQQYIDEIVQQTEVATSGYYDFQGCE